MMVFRIFLPLQVREVRESNILSVLKALEQPNVEVEMLIQQQKMRYESKYSFTGPSPGIVKTLSLNLL